MTALAKHRMNIRYALTTPLRPMKEVLPGLHAGTVGTVIAPGSTGKTMFLLQVAVAIATGAPVLGGLLKSCAAASDSLPQKVVMVVAEETAEEMQRRLNQVVVMMCSELPPPLLSQEARDAFLDLLAENLLLFPLCGRMRLLVETRDGPTEQLQELEDACEGAQLLIVDPLRQFHTGDENDSWAMTAVLQAFQRVAGRHGCAVLLAHHTNKAAMLNGHGDQALASRGSGALTDGVRWQMNLSRLDERLAAAYGIAAHELGWYIRADLAKANYLPPQPPQVFQRSKEFGGALMRMTPPEAVSRAVRRRKA